MPRPKIPTVCALATKTETPTMMTTTLADGFSLKRPEKTEETEKTERTEEMERTV